MTKSSPKNKKSFGKKLRVLALVDSRLLPPDDVSNLSEKEIQPFKTEFDVITTLKHMGHSVKAVGVDSDLGVIRDALINFNPQVTFNLLEEFGNNSLFDQHVVSYLELMRQSYTGCNPRGLTLAHDKALSKKILSFHRINVPSFAVYPVGSKVKKSSRHKFPMIVKSLIEEGSIGISQSSLVNDLDKLKERVEFMHRRHQTHVIAEQYIPGRELYVGVIGNQRLIVLPTWELCFKNLPEGSANIATDKVKWSYDYQEKVGVYTELAKNISPEIQTRIYKISRAIYKILNLSGYARLDFRLTPNGKLYLLEANPNPNLSYGEDFAESAEKVGIEYEDLLQKIITLGKSYQPAAAVPIVETSEFLG